MGQSTPVLEKFREAIKEDLAMLASLHDRELDFELLTALRDSEFPSNLGLRLTSSEAASALGLMEKTVRAIPDPVETVWLDELAADFAHIYLTFGCRAAPTESPWLDEDGLERQRPMFDVRQWYQHHGLSVPNWQVRSDDHLVHELNFLGHLVSLDVGEESLREAGRFMDHHLLVWIGLFAKKVSTHCATPFYAALAQLTAVYLDELREIIAQVLGEPRATPEELEARRMPRIRQENRPQPEGCGI